MIRFTPFLLLLASGATTGCALAGESRLAIASESTVAIAGATALAADAHFPARMGLAAAREVLGSDAQQMDLVFVELTTIQARVDEHGRIRFAATAWTYGFEDRSSGAATVISVSRDGRTQRKGAASSSRHATIPDSWSIDMDDLSAIVAGLSPPRDIHITGRTTLRLSAWHVRSPAGEVRRFVWLVPLVDIGVDPDATVSYGQSGPVLLVDPVSGRADLAPPSSTITSAD